MYDLFISYSRRDDERSQVASLKARIESRFRAFAGRDLNVFCDVHSIQGMEDWRHTIQRSLRESRLFLAVLSPNYLDSQYCRWEWEDYVRYEAMRQCLGDGVAPVLFITLSVSSDKTSESVVRWMKEIGMRQSFDLRAWHDLGERALQQPEVKHSLENLQTSLLQRLDRFERAARSPENLMRHNPTFVGRVRELSDLRDALALNKLGIVGGRDGQPSGRATVQGLGGMGKTELALAYAHAYAWDYPGGRWQVACDHISDLRVALLQLAGPLKIEFSGEETKSLALSFDRVLRELNLRERCLLLLDNVSDPHLLEPEHLDRLPRDGRLDLIATTRLAPHAIPGSVQAQTFIAVDELPEEDGLALMRSHQPPGHFSNQDEDDCAREIVRLLGGFTLAIETAAIYLGRSAEGITCAQFLSNLRAQLIGHSEQAAADSTVAIRHRERLLEKTLDFTLSTLSPEARHLLDLAALLPADSIALPWLEAVGTKQFAILANDARVSKSLFDQIKKALFGLRLLQPAHSTNAEEPVRVARMHRLVQEILGRSAGLQRTPLFENLVSYGKGRCDFLKEHWLDPASRWEIEPLRMFGEDLLVLDHPEASYVGNSIAFCLHDLARYAEAEALLRHALVIDERRFGPDHHDVATRLNNLAQVLKATNRRAEAEQLQRRALTIDEPLYGPTHPKVATELNNLAQLLKSNNQLAEAETLLRRAVAIDERHREVFPAHVSSINNLAQLLKDTNRLEEAEPLMKRALTLDEENLGPDHPDVARDLNNLAGLLLATNRLTEAEPLMRRALAIDEQCLGSSHPAVARDLVSLSALLRDLNQLPEAELLMRRALGIDEMTFGPDHPEVGLDFANLAQLLSDMDRKAEAEPLMRRALAIEERCYGAEHPRVAIDLNNLAVLLMDTNRPEEAEPLIRRALAIDERSLGPDHTDVANRLNNLAMILRVTHRATEAEPLMRRALAINERSLGPNHPKVASALSNLGVLLLETRRALEAEPLMRRALAINERSFGPDRPEVTGDLDNLAMLLETASRFTEAEPLLERVVETFLRLTVAAHQEHPGLRQAIRNYSDLLQKSGNHPKEIQIRLNRVARPFGIRFGHE